MYDLLLQKYNGFAMGQAIFQESWILLSDIFKSSKWAMLINISPCSAVRNNSKRHYNKMVEYILIYKELWKVAFMFNLHIIQPFLQTSALLMLLFISENDEKHFVSKCGFSEATISSRYISLCFTLFVLIASKFLTGSENAELSKAI